MALHPTKLWWTAGEIADAALPDVPHTKRRVNSMADRLGWQCHPTHARRRKGRGGGWEYLWELFPVAARKRLLAEAAPANETPELGRTEIWAWFDGLPEATQAKARKRLQIIQMVDGFERSGQTRFLAVDGVATMEAVSARTIWNWFSMIEFKAPDDRLPYLAPRHRAAVRKDKKAVCDREFMDLLKGDFLRLEKPPFASCYRRIVKIAKAKGLAILTDRTARRRLNETVPRVSQIFAREGYTGLARCFPPQTRDRSQMVAMEGVNADCHKFDVFVIWPGETKPSRAQIIAFQDLYSNKILSWRVDYSPNKVAVMAAFGDLIEDYGIPKHCLFDNGMEFANKWLTGGTKTRFRFKIREDDPLGVLPQLGIKIHWATPAHGQAKPIERGFRDFANDIAMDPRFAGAYVGNNVDAKPENYMSKAIPIAEFLRVVSEGVADHNARLGRLSDTALGRSFDETFASSYANAPISKATEEQRRLWLMGQEVLKMQQGHGQIKMHKNEYWSDWMNEHAGQKVIVRFDPEDLHAGTYIYALDGAFMGFAECKEKVGFFDLVGAQEHARITSHRKRAEKRLLEANRPIGVKEVAAELDALSAPIPAALEAKVVRPSFGKASKTPLIDAPVYEITRTADEIQTHNAFVVGFEKKQAAQKTTEEVPDTARNRFRRALELEEKSEGGKRIGEAEARWLVGYQQTSEYRGERRVWEDFEGKASS